jgi:hypothetical protein
MAVASSSRDGASSAPASPAAANGRTRSLSHLAPPDASQLRSLLSLHSSGAMPAVLQLSRSLSLTRGGGHAGDVLPVTGGGEAAGGGGEAAGGEGGAAAASNAFGESGTTAGEEASR